MISQGPGIKTLQSIPLLKRDRLPRLPGWSVPELDLDGVWEKQYFLLSPIRDHVTRRINVLGPVIKTAAFRHAVSVHGNYNESGVFGCLIYSTHGILAAPGPSDPGVLSALYPWVWMALSPLPWEGSLSPWDSAQPVPTVLSDFGLEFGTERRGGRRHGKDSGHQAGGQRHRSDSISPCLAPWPGPSHFPSWAPAFPLVN